MNDNRMNKIEIYDDFYLFFCPHCNMTIFVYKNERNCGIFRCAIHKQGKAINPHASKEDCEKLVIDDMIYGCGKPFIIRNFHVEPCDYI